MNALSKTQNYRAACKLALTHSDTQEPLALSYIQENIKRLFMSGEVDKFLPFWLQFNEG